MAPPLLTPAKMDSWWANFLAISSASSWVTVRIWSTLFGSYIFGRYSSRHLRMPGMLAPSAGCTPTICTSGFFYLRYRDTPIIVPVVPIADTK